MEKNVTELKINKGRQQDASSRKQQNNVFQENNKLETYKI